MAKKSGSTTRRGTSRKVAEQPGANGNAAVYTTKIALATAFDTSQQSIDLYTRRPDFPGGRGGPWEHDAVAAWLNETGSAVGRLPREQRRGGGHSIASDTKAAVEALKAREQYRKLKLHNDLLEGELVRRDEVVRDFAEKCSWIKARLESVPAQLEMQWPLEVRAERTKEIESFIYSLLKEMANWEILPPQPPTQR
jgi:hypothetical protein